MSTWWIGKTELDKDQYPIVSLPIEDSVLITGPPGSGKTNLLLLRANYLFLYPKKNIAIITFTRALREFIASGASNYDFPASKIVTSKEWYRDVILQYGGKPSVNAEFLAARRENLSELQRLVDKFKLENIFEAILLDEAQDYLPEEIRLFDTLSERLFCVADGRQKIYDGEDPIELIKELVDQHRELTYHYRNGRKICLVADAIAKKWPGYSALATTSNYNDIENPSEVEDFPAKILTSQIELIIGRLAVQLTTFPNDLIGIVSPKQDIVNIVWAALKNSSFQDEIFLLSGAGKQLEGKKIIVGTCHAVKGFEFRSMHIISAELLKKFENNRKITFTAVTRAKTTLSIYHEEDLHGYFDSAISAVKVVGRPPTIDDAFGAKK